MLHVVWHRHYVTARTLGVNVLNFVRLDWCCFCCVCVWAELAHCTACKLVESRIPYLHSILLSRLCLQCNDGRYNEQKIDITFPTEQNLMINCRDTCVLPMLHAIMLC